MVFYESGGKKYFDERLITLLKREEYMPVIRIIEKTSVRKLKDCYDTTLLHIAAKYNNVFIMMYLRDRGCDINAIDKYSRTPLIMAVMNESIEAVNFLLDVDADIYLACFHGNSALKIATRFRKSPRSTSIVRLFFRKMTLDLAAHCFDDFEVVEKLRQINCPLYRVIYLNNADVTKLMIERKYCCVNCRDPDTGNTALHEAVIQRDLNNILVLLDSGADIHVRNRRGETSMVHKFSNNVDILKALLKTNTVWTEPDDYDNEVMKLGQVFGKGTREAVQLFLKHQSVDLKARDDFGRTPLHYLIENTNKGVLELFEDAEFDVDARDKGNYAALHVAADRGDPDIVRFLLDKGADVNIKGYLGCPPLFYATAHMSFESHRKKRCIELLMLYGADPEFVKGEETVLGFAQRIGQSSLIEPVLAHFALMEASGKTVSKRNRDRIDSHQPTKDYYELCQLEIERMKEDQIYGSLMVFAAITMSEYRMTRYVLIPEVSSRFAREEFDYNSYYNRMLRRRFDRAVEIVGLRKIASRVVSRAIEVFHEDHIVIDVVVNFLTYEDLKKVCEGLSRERILYDTVLTL